MKQIVLTPITIALTSISNVSPDKCYGVKYHMGGDTFRKAFIHREHLDKGVYIARSITELTRGNNCNRVEFDKYTDLTTFIKFLINQRNHTVFEFDTTRELFLWLADDEKDIVPSSIRKFKHATGFFHDTEYVCIDTKTGQSWDILKNGRETKKNNKISIHDAIRHVKNGDWIEVFN